MQLQFDVSHQIITRRDRNKVVAVSRNYLDMLFSFTPDWNGLRKLLYIQHKGDRYNVELINGRARIDIPNDGVMKLSVQGTATDEGSTVISAVYEDFIAIVQSGFHEAPARYIRSLNIYEIDIVNGIPCYEYGGAWYSLIGPKGEQGPQGIQGFRGAKGDKGDRGEQGPQGVQGVKGDTGSQGIQGLQGEQGALGLQGEQGQQGLRGEKGDIGPQGPQGIQGEQGLQGIQGVQGDVGSQGIQGLQGPPGSKGNTGGVTAPVNGFFTMYVDVDGNLYVVVADGGTGTIPMRYDTETGSLYYVI